MKMTARITLYVLILAASCSIAAAADNTAEERFREGVELYTAGRYHEALEVWESLYKTGYVSANLTYNIGNACFKVNNIPGAILFYERALLLKPGSEDIRYNLGMARTLTVDKFTEIPEVFFVTWYNFISLTARSNTWAMVSVFSFLLFILTLAFYLFSRRYRLKVASFWLALFFLMISGSTLSFSLRNRYLVNNSGKAIVVHPQVNGKSSPDEGGTELFLIHEGTKVTITDSLREWYEIRLPDGNKGWVPLNSVEKI